MIKNKKRLLINILTIFFILFSVRIYIDNNLYEITYVEVKDNKIPNSFDNAKILHISDLHNKKYGENQRKLIEQINIISPDYIFLTGDLVSSKDTDFSNFYDLASCIGQKYDCYYILGNHEMDLSNEVRRSIYEKLESFNITVLDNEKKKLIKNGESINIYGMWYNPKYYMREDFSLQNMQSILGKSDSGFNILLTHNPDDFNVYALWGADLIFSGHVHGGMIRLPIIGGLISPNRTLFPKYDSGLYSEYNSNMVVSRGMSRGATGIRIFNQPELVVVTLNTNSKESE